MAQRPFQLNSEGLIDRKPVSCGQAVAECHQADGVRRGGRKRGQDQRQKRHAQAAATIRNTGFVDMPRRCAI